MRREKKQKTLEAFHQILLPMLKYFSFETYSYPFHTKAATVIACDSGEVSGLPSDKLLGVKWRLNIGAEDMWSLAGSRGAP